MQFRKQSLGLDVAKDTFSAHLMAQPLQSGADISRGKRTFNNTPAGFKKLVHWVTAKRLPGVPLTVAMEATGIYHESLAYHLHRADLEVAILLPNKVKDFARSLNRHSKTDAIDAHLIARMALERTVETWQPPAENLRQLRHLSRERKSLIQDKLRHTNRLHAIEHGELRAPRTAARHRATIKLLDRQIAAIAAEMKALGEGDEELGDLLERAQSIPRVGLLTAAAIIGETGGFALFTGRAQLIKYAGLDIIERQSGSSVLGPARISKRGNGYLRAALHMPAVGLIRNPGPFQDIYLRVYGRTKCKMKGIVAVQRKLLTVLYALVKNGQNYETAIHRLRAKEVGGSENPPTATATTEAVAS